MATWWQTGPSGARPTHRPGGTRPPDGHALPTGTADDPRGRPQPALRRTAHALSVTHFEGAP